MKEQTTTLLLEAIAAQRLVLLCGAGLSMAPPSSLPSAVAIAQLCAAEYALRIGPLPDLLPPNDLEALARHMRTGGQLGFFLDEIVPWPRFKAEHNGGHEAIADLLACGALFVAATTNFDALVERAAAQHVREPDFRAIVDQHDIAKQRPHRPYLKLHGCETRRRDQTIWCREQLDEAAIATTLQHFRTWLSAQVLDRDLLLVGFWSDWAYLTELLATHLAGIAPRNVYLVDPDTPARLQAKAPDLWAWAHGPGIVFHHEQESGADFLKELRKQWSTRFLAQSVASAEPTHQALFGTVQPLSPNYGQLSVEDLYALRRDLTGTPHIAPVRDRIPQQSNRTAAAIHARLLAVGAVYAQHTYTWNGRRFRLISGQGQVLSAVKAQFRGEAPMTPEIDAVYCAGAFEDPSPAHLVRSTESRTIVRGGNQATWQTHDALVSTLGEANA